MCWVVLGAHDESCPPKNVLNMRLSMWGELAVRKVMPVKCATSAPS